MVDATADAADRDDAAWPKFIFDSFITQTSACPVTQYQIFHSEQLHDVPFGLTVSNPIAEINTPGVVNANTFEVPVTDPKTPYQLSFVIQSRSVPEILYYSPSFTLTVRCPDSIEFTVQGAYQTYMQSYVNAAANDILYTFPRSVSKLPKCSNVVEYLVEDVSPAGTVFLYPGCMVSPCLTVQFDVSQERALSFNIRPRDGSELAPQSSTITIDVLAEYNPPSLSLYNFGEGGQVDESLSVLLDSPSKFTFVPFQCSSGCVVTNYQVSSSPNSVV